MPRGHAIDSGELFIQPNNMLATTTALGPLTVSVVARHRSGPPRLLDTRPF